MAITSRKLVLAAWALAMTFAAAAQTSVGPLRQAYVGAKVEIPAGALSPDIRIPCPTGMQAIDVTAWGALHSGDDMLANGVVGPTPFSLINKGPIPDDPSQFLVTVMNNSARAALAVSLHVICVPSGDIALTLASASSTIAPNGSGSAAIGCDGDQVIVGGGFFLARSAPYSPGGMTEFADSMYFDALQINTSVGNLGAGITLWPSRWSPLLLNNQTTPLGLRTLAYCAANSGIQTSIGVETLDPDNDSFIWTPVPDSAMLLGTAHEDGSAGATTGTARWIPGVGYTFHMAGGYAGTVQGGAAITRVRNTTAPSKTAAKTVTIAKSAAVFVPTTARVAPTVRVAVIEYYHPGRDHYFITASPDEIGKLDSGFFKGWARTGQTFNAYAPGSSGPLGRRPVCRYYGDPAAGLDSHFYTASAKECYATGANFAGAWILESDEVFQIDLPESSSGQCPPGDVAVYRVWNARTDSNHRYTTSRTTRDQMVGLGYVAEGYGPDRITLCALP